MIYMNILELFQTNAKYKSKVEQLIANNGNIIINNISTNIAKLAVVDTFLKTNKTIVVVYPNIFYANQAYEDYLELLPADKISFFPVEEIIASELVASSSTFRMARMKTIVNVLNDIPQIIITNTEGYTRQTMSKKRLLASFINIKVGDIYNMNSLVDDLVTRGYKKCAITENEGTFSVRGSLIDIFLVNQEYPVRIDFFDNEINSIKSFDVSTQLSIKKIDSSIIYPVYEMHYASSQITSIKEAILADNKQGKKIQNDINLIEEYSNLDQLYIYLPYIDENYLPFIDLIKDKIVFFSEYKQIIEKENQNYLELSQYLEQIEFVGKEDFFKSIIYLSVNNDKNVYLTQFKAEIDDSRVNCIISFDTVNNIDYNNNIKNMVNDIKLNKQKTYLITHEDDKKLILFEEIFKSNNLEYQKITDFKDIRKKAVNICVCENALGYIDYEENFEVITPNEFASGKVTRHHRFQKLYNKSTKVYSKDELLPGDYVVHQDYGIGKYLGITTVELNKIKNDYLLIEYAAESKLYIPVENIYVLEKYLGSGDKIPKLTQAGGKDWQKKKAKIAERVAKVAKKLIEIQAKRSLLKGYQYAADSLEQKEFEKDFGYNETEGQLAAINDVKQDMESEKPLDRLLCGDVGFGKTEVAMRAAFKCVDNGKQVAYLVPTTVLARQHYNSFRERFEKYGIRVELLSRFVDGKTTKNVLQGMEKGYVDIVIGTHRLLSNDIKFKDLGLLIIDEEQRFGVEHKEKIKEMKANIDVLSLSATPIPRTLQMSLTGLRDLSLIETPPVNRLSVQTYVLEVNESVIREAIRRELGRNGQVFYLINRISELDKVKQKIHRLVPEAKIGVIHGKMEREDIEEVLNYFLDDAYNVLVCTTIIETGIDIPNANTIIIENADTLGLAQIYQIRGRVGRSDRLAYAYLMYNPAKVLTEVSKKRLDSIKEFTALGSGYKIAMRDLAIRGAGDILGSEQSGFIDEIGINLYMKLLNAAIEKAKGNMVAEEQPTYVNINVSKHIDKTYVSDDTIRIAMHQSISKVHSRSEITNLINEFVDRYGRINDELLIYVESKYLEFLLKSKGVETYITTDKTVEFNFDKAKTATINYPLFVGITKNYADGWRFEYRSDRIYVKIPLNKTNQSLDDNHYVYQLTRFLEKI